MQNIFIGLALILFNADAAFGNTIINIFPSFAGYFLLYRGLTALDGKSAHFSAIKPLCTLLMIYELAVWTIDVLAIRHNVAAIFAEFISSAGVIYVTYHIARGIGDIQKKTSVELGYGKLCDYWKYSVTISSIFNLLSLVFVRVSLILTIISLISGMFFLSAFYKTKKHYYDNL